jgi:hypothetical protein
MKKFTIITFAALFVLSFVSQSMGEAISYDISEKAELKKVSFYKKNIRKKSNEKAIVFEVTIQNTDSTPQLYSVTVVMPGAGGAEGFIPAKGDKKLEPSKEGTTSIGIIWPEFPKEGFTIVIKPIESR